MSFVNKPSRQSGSSLIISLIMLALLTLFVLSAVNSGLINLRIAGNTQSRDEARAAAQRAIETFISVSANFTAPPTVPTVSTVSINNDAANSGDYSVSVAPPVCKRAAQQVPAKTIECANGAKALLFCWDTLWEVTATATRGGTSQTITQGVSISFGPSFVPSSC